MSFCPRTRFMMKGKEFLAADVVIAFCPNHNEKKADATREDGWHTKSERVITLFTRNGSYAEFSWSVPVKLLRFSKLVRSFCNIKHWFSTRVDDSLKRTPRCICSSFSKKAEYCSNILHKSKSIEWLGPAALTIQDIGPFWRMFREKAVSVTQEKTRRQHRWPYWDLL